jgi:hypothetical protein
LYGGNCPLTGFANGGIGYSPSPVVIDIYPPAVVPIVCITTFSPSIVRLDMFIVRPSHVTKHASACDKSDSNFAISASKPSNVIGVYGVFAPKKTIGKHNPFINVAMIK